jgi:putative chitinase
MKALTSQILAQLYGTPLATCALYVDYLNADMAQREINTPNRVAAFLGQVGIESSGLTKVEENLHYTTPERLDAMFSAVHGAADAAALIRKGPQAIGNRVYANRNGNGDEASGDGWKYRGLGLIQLTGKNNHADFGNAISMPLAQGPDYLITPRGASDAACWYWQRHGLNALADGWQISNITRAINGNAMEKAAERLALSNKAKAILT